MANNEMAGTIDNDYRQADNGADQGTKDVDMDGGDNENENRPPPRLMITKMVCLPSIEKRSENRVGTVPTKLHQTKRRS